MVCLASTSEYDSFTYNYTMDYKNVPFVGKIKISHKFGEWITHFSSCKTKLI